MECAFTSPVMTEYDMFVMYCTVCTVVCPCQLFCSAWMSFPKRYINVCNCDMFSVVNVYLDHLSSVCCVVCLEMYVCCCECNVIFNECYDPTFSLVQPIGMHGGEVLGVFVLGVCLVS